MSFKSPLHEDNLKGIVGKIAEHTNIPIVYSARVEMLVKNRVYKLKVNTRKHKSKAVVKWHYYLQVSGNSVYYHVK